MLVQWVTMCISMADTGVQKMSQLQGQLGFIFHVLFEGTSISHSLHFEPPVQLAGWGVNVSDKL